MTRHIIGRAVKKIDAGTYTFEYYGRGTYTFKFTPNNTFRSEYGHHDMKKIRYDVVTGIVPRFIKAK